MSGLPFAVSDLSGFIERFNFPIINMRSWTLFDTGERNVAFISLGGSMDRKLCASWDLDHYPSMNKFIQDNIMNNDLNSVRNLLCEELGVYAPSSEISPVTRWSDFDIFV